MAQYQKCGADLDKENPCSCEPRVCCCCCSCGPKCKCGCQEKKD